MVIQVISKRRKRRMYNLKSPVFLPVWFNAICHYQKMTRKLYGDARAIQPTTIRGFGAASIGKLGKPSIKEHVSSHMNQI